MRALIFTVALALMGGATVVVCAQDKDEDEKAPEEPGLRDLMPSWEAGTEWEVEYSPLAAFSPKDGSTEILKRETKKKVRAKFVVKGKKNLGGVNCYVVLVTSDERPNEETTLHVRAQDFTLKELRRKTLPKGTESVVTNDRTPFVWLELSTICPLDWPLFPRESKDEERTFELGEGRKISQKITIAKDTVTVELKTQWVGKPLVSTLTWKKGDPWWTTCVRTLDGKEDDRGELDPKSIKTPKPPK